MIKQLRFRRERSKCLPTPTVVLWISEQVELVFRRGLPRQASGRVPVVLELVSRPIEVGSVERRALCLIIEIASDRVLIALRPSPGEEPQLVSLDRTANGHRSVVDVPNTAHRFQTKSAQ